MYAVTLGTASAYPTPNRGVSCTAIKLEDGNVWLFDCGEGSQIQLQKSSLKFGRISKIFITHLHGDHIFGLPGLLCTMGIHLSDKFCGGIHVFGPQGIRKFLRTSLSLSHSTLPFTYTVHELVLNSDQMLGEKEGGCFGIQSAAEGPLHPQETLGQDIIAIDCVWDVYEDEKIIVQAGPIEHKIACFGYVLTEKDRPGKLNTQLLMDKGIPPGPIYGKIKNGESVSLPDGSTLILDDVIGPPKKGAKITILGDTSNPYKIAGIARDSDILFHETTYLDELKDKALEHGHSTPSMAAQFAKDVRAKKLVLLHYSHRYKTNLIGDPKEKSVDLRKLLDEAEEGLKKIGFSNCHVVLADDLMELSI